MITELSLVGAGNRHLQDVATKLYREALRKGLLVPGDRCADCRVRPARIHGHHEDYAKPFEVVWLCAKCHRRRHSHTDRMRPRCIVCCDVIYWHLLKAGIYATESLAGAVHRKCLRRMGGRIQRPTALSA